MANGIEPISGSGSSVSSSLARTASQILDVPSVPNVVQPVSNTAPAPTTQVSNTTKPSDSSEYAQVFSQAIEQLMMKVVQKKVTEPSPWSKLAAVTKDIQKEIDEEEQLSDPDAPDKVADNITGSKDDMKTT